MTKLRQYPIEGKYGQYGGRFVPEVLMNANDIISVREQIQEDLICLLATQFDDEGQMDEVQRIACQIVVDNFTQLLK